MDGADIALVNGDVTELPHLIALSKRMMRTIKLNITFSLTLNFIAIVLVITNSALLLKWRQTASQSFAAPRRNKMKS